MGGFGALIFGGGCCLILYAFLGMDISAKAAGVAVPSGAGVDAATIINLDMLGRRDMVMMVACAAIVVGALMMLMAHVLEVIGAPAPKTEGEPSSASMPSSRHEIGWICSCGTRNADFDAKKCWSCGSVRGELVWRCRCGAENDVGVGVCGTCKRSKSAVY